jgi:hypothetical protein
MTAEECHVSCSADHQPIPGGLVPRATCATDHGIFELSGCHPACNAPPKAKAKALGYELDSCDTSGGSILGSACTVSCAPGFHGVPEVSCLAGGGVFQLSSCERNSCEAMATKGYDIDGCTPSHDLSIYRHLLQPESCRVRCAAGFVGTAYAACNSHLSKFDFSGCEPRGLT